MVQFLYRKKFWSATAVMTALTLRAPISFWNHLRYGRFSHSGSHFI